MFCFRRYPGAPGAPHAPPAEGLKISPLTRPSSMLAAAPCSLLGPAGAAVRAFQFCRTVAVLCEPRALPCQIDDAVKRCCEESLLICYLAQVDATD
ncbi:hypothetical protein BU25DRAFT_83543 [Macroventuria anomochaeta]|uniref:Uncharacterized protein n=1 Tax=Macroventuria anomochaeta TaxID=301207 RepID=A0ACB6SHI4_9PLEO|nr:uncharacterized protein BU25DRAFT_83543 [Macroventuria anomochaeta]KAF2632813.1 hypothetical protein BU25DRAFT_83543 [Macroventuria anomochaeta]